MDFCLLCLFCFAFLFHLYHWGQAHPAQHFGKDIDARERRLCAWSLVVWYELYIATSSPLGRTSRPWRRCKLSWLFDHLSQSSSLCISWWSHQVLGLRNSQTITNHTSSSCKYPINSLHSTAQLDHEVSSRQVLYIHLNFLVLMSLSLLSVLVEMDHFEYGILKNHKNHFVREWHYVNISVDLTCVPVMIQRHSR